MEIEKIVVATDFSSNSKKGVHFALQLATQKPCELIFYHVVEIFKPSIWDTIYYEQYETDELERNQKVLERFIRTICQKSNILNLTYKCVCQVGTSAASKIIAYAGEVKARYICVSTIGGGSIKQLLGTIASELITFSPTPVFVIPKNYKTKPIKSILFASDLKQIDDELKSIEKFSLSLHIKIDIFNYDYQSLLDFNKNKTDKMIKNYEKKNIQFYLLKLAPPYSLVQHLKTDIIKMRPSLLIMFTKQNHNWFNRLFLTSFSADMIFDTKIPILVFKKL